jgi:hypothetical protein
MGKVLVGLGAALVLAGIVVWAVESRAGAGWRLPGDFQFGGRNWQVYVPLASSILLSLLLTGVLNLVLMLARRR